jgi:hypothetical protein
MSVRAAYSPVRVHPVRVQPGSRTTGSRTTGSRSIRVLRLARARAFMGAETPADDWRQLFQVPSPHCMSPQPIPCPDSRLLRCFVPVPGPRFLSQAPPPGTSRTPSRQPDSDQPPSGTATLQRRVVGLGCRSGVSRTVIHDSAKPRRAYLHDSAKQRGRAASLTARTPRSSTRSPPKPRSRRPTTRPQHLLQRPRRAPAGSAGYGVPEGALVFLGEVG